MNQTEKMFKIINKYFIIIYIIMGVGLGVYNIFFSTPYYIMLGFASILFLFIPDIIYKVLKLKKVYILNFTIYLFCFLSFNIGMTLNGYSRIPQYDKLVHTLSGVFFALLGLGFYYVLKPIKKLERSDYSIVSFFSVMFSLSIAVIWEIYEYTIDFLLHTDPQRVSTTGINDTMIDMIVCFIGALIMWLSIYLYYRRNKINFFMSVFENFFNINIKK